MHLPVLPANLLTLLLCFCWPVTILFSDTSSVSLNQIQFSSPNLDTFSQVRVRRQKPPPPPPQTFEDEEVRAFWGGSCLAADWERCKHKRRLRGRFWVPNLPEHLSVQYHPNRTIDCSLLKPYWCLKNEWTVTDCQLLCMANCNRVVLKDLFNYVSHAGECQMID